MRRALLTTGNGGVSFASVLLASRSGSGTGAAQNFTVGSIYTIATGFVLTGMGVYGRGSATTANLQLQVYNTTGTILAFANASSYALGGTATAAKVNLNTPVTLNAGTQYLFAIYSAAAIDSIIDAGTSSPSPAGVLSFTDGPFYSAGNGNPTSNGVGIFTPASIVLYK